MRFHRALLDVLGRVGAWLREGKDAFLGRNLWAEDVRWDLAYGAGYRDGVRDYREALHAWQLPDSEAS